MTWAASSMSQHMLRNPLRGGNLVILEPVRSPAAHHTPRTVLLSGRPCPNALLVDTDGPCAARTRSRHKLYPLPRSNGTNAVRPARRLRHVLCVHKLRCGAFSHRAKTLQPPILFSLPAAAVAQLPSKTRPAHDIHADLCHLSSSIFHLPKRLQPLLRARHQPLLPPEHTPRPPCATLAPPCSCCASAPSSCSPCATSCPTRSWSS